MTTATQPTVVVVIPVHNRLHLTIECLSCLKKAASLVKIGVVIVDDGSTDGTSEWLSRNAPDITILQGDGNLWFGGALQKAIEYIRSTMPDVDYLMTLNNDTFLLPGCVDALVQESKGDGVVSVLLLDRACKRIHCFGAFWDLWKGWVFYLTGEPLSAHPELGAGVSKPVEMHNTTATLIPAKWLRKIPGIDPCRYLQHKADTQLFSRLNRAGAPLRVTSLAVATNDPEPSQVPYSFRNRSFARFMRESLTDKTCPLHLPTLLMCAWETAPTRFHSVPVMVRTLLLYARQVALSLLLCGVLPIFGRKSVL